MYKIPRNLWITIYIATWGFLVFALAMGVAAWLYITLAAIALGFAVLTDPEPRTYRDDPRTDGVPCDCHRCGVVLLKDPERPDDAA